MKKLCPLLLVFAIFFSFVITANAVQPSREEILNAYFEKIGFPLDVISKMDYIQKDKIYRTLHDDGVADECVYGGFAEQTVSLQNTKTRKTVIPKKILKFSAPYVRAGNNLQRYYIYPTFEWVYSRTTITQDAFSYALDSSEWDCLVDGTFELYQNDKLISSIKNASQADFCARTYTFTGSYFQEFGYKGIGCMVVRPRINDADLKILLNYAQGSPLVDVQIALGDFSITVSQAEASRGVVMKWGEKE